MDKICIDDLKIFARHGVFEHENTNGQDFYVSAQLWLDTESAGMTDDLEKSVDYGAVCGLIGKVMTENTFKLIESAAQAVAEAILTAYPLVRQADVEVHKPHAPIPMDFRSVSVKISRSWHKALIALGSNIGDSRTYISDAVEKLRSSKYIREVKQSDLIVTKPYGYTDQDDFLNGAVLCETFLSPHGLLDLMHCIENEADRKREIHWGPRTLDLDLIFYDKEVIDTPDLTVPHPDMQNRDFVLRPAAELMPNYIHPVLGISVAELLRKLKENG